MNSYLILLIILNLFQTNLSASKKVKKSAKNETNFDLSLSKEKLVQLDLVLLKDLTDRSSDYADELKTHIEMRDAKVKEQIAQLSDALKMLIEKIDVCFSLPERVMKCFKFLFETNLDKNLDIFHRERKRVYSEYEKDLTEMKDIIKKYEEFIVSFHEIKKMVKKNIETQNKGISDFVTKADEDIAKWGKHIKEGTIEQLEEFDELKEELAENKARFTIVDFFNEKLKDVLVKIEKDFDKMTEKVEGCRHHMKNINRMEITMKKVKTGADYRKLAKIIAVEKDYTGWEETILPNGMKSRVKKYYPKEEL